ncbi:hypothetical protein Srot_0656 [Segniliparus rotundus DSM 44985]|uniref:Uncharacterized protein n=1 Tax=Segniliparus rotundus (strain ATCC BAA-972 / CDC 1076 / CIP 108378 / DSM 44985 / JCM 13578) TaxID=640132 RepID=D6ZD74_SEGRD|nr:hypothetical protein [Segniliparus rotundus]ADG97138.1 hypothetical protein Srot_0656 [Segniliparus rotundus DSM 44985]
MLLPSVPRLGPHACPAQARPARIRFALPLRLLAAGSAPVLLSAGCGFLSGDGRVTVATATVTVTPESTSQTPAPTSAAPEPAPQDPNEPAELNGLELADPSGFMRGQSSWVFATASGNTACKFVVGEGGFCHVADDSGPPWSSGWVCDLHRGQDPDGARSSLVGWESDYRQKPCHTLLEGEWPDNAPTLPAGKKIVLQVDPEHGVTVTCGQQGANITCANNAEHGFTIRPGAAPKLW